MWCLSVCFLPCSFVFTHTTLQDKRLLGFLEVESPKISDHGHTKVVRLSDLRTGRLYPREITHVFLSVRGWVESRVIVPAEELSK